MQLRALVFGVVLLLHVLLFALLLLSSPPSPPAVVKLPTLTGVLIAPSKQAAAAVLMPASVQPEAAAPEIKQIPPPIKPAIAKPEPEPKPKTAAIPPKPIEPQPISQKKLPPTDRAVQPAAASSTSATVKAVSTSASSHEALHNGSAPNESAPLTLPPVDASQLNNPAPSYPPLSRRMREQGEVLLEVLIQADGRVGEVRIKRSSGFKRLDDAASKAVQRWRYVPATRGGSAIEYWYLQPIEFSLTNS